MCSFERLGAPAAARVELLYYSLTLIISRPYYYPYVLNGIDMSVRNEANQPDGLVGRTPFGGIFWGGGHFFFLYVYVYVNGMGWGWDG